jgi:hypothetical protein
MLKVRFTAIAAAFVMALTLPLSAQSASDFEFRARAITGYKGTAKDVVIPAEINGIPVTSIGRAFAYKKLTSVVIPDSVTSIGNGAFNGNQLTSITIPDSVTSIGDSAFRGNQLTSVVIPDSVTSIGGWAFGENQLTSVTIPSSVTSIGNGVFAKNQLTNVTIPDSVTFLGEWAFENNRLTGLTLSYGLTSIGVGAFENNQLTVVTIPDSVTSLGRRAFANNVLSGLTLSAGLTKIEERAFANNQLTSLIVPENVTSIGSYAFEKNKLTVVSLPNNAEISSIFAENPIDEGFINYYSSWGKRAGTYSKAENGWSFTLSETEAKRVAAEDDFDIEQLVDGTLKITDYTGTAKNVVIPDTISGVKVTVIGGLAFSGKGLYSVVIPDCVTVIEASGYDRGSSYSGPSGAFARNTLTRVSIGKGLKTIPDFAFYGNKTLTTLTLPDGITEIGGSAFCNCGLSDITWGKGLITIKIRAFAGNNFTALAIPNGVTYIAPYALGGNSLTTIALPASLAQYLSGNSNRGLRGALSSNDATMGFSFSGDALNGLTRITVPANMAEENLMGFPAGFLNYWKSQNKSAGTYVFTGRLWLKQ